MSNEAQAMGRWKPTRAGIRNIWEYDEQVFTFADGRMILRGPNGSGKSNALALIFPFLFDGTMSAAAMDPFAGGRSMKSLLLGVLRDDDRSGFRHDNRLGYVWIEFGRSGPDGDQYMTVGCGARARSDGDARSWFFLTDRRVGVDLDLAPDNTPLTRGNLIEELGADAVRDGAEEHRQVVARNLLGIEPDQLSKLNGLIRALRRPQLAGKLNLDELSSVLSSGLPAVASSTLDDIAASLDDLERVQHELAAVRDALGTVDTFLPTYQSYLGGEARLRVGSVLDHERRLAAEQRDLARHDKRHGELKELDASLQAQRTAAELEQSNAAAERDALKDSERFKGAQELEREETHAVALEVAAEAANERRGEAVQSAKRLEERAADAEHQALTFGADADRYLRDTMDHADRVRATWDLDRAAHHDAQQLRSGIDVMVRERRDAIDVVRKAIRIFEAAVFAHRSAEESRSEADQAVDRAVVQVQAALTERDQVRGELSALVATWVAEVPGLDDDQGQALGALVDRVAEGEAIGFGERYRLVTESYRDALRDELGAITRSIADHEERRREVQDERDAVAAEVDPGPAAPPWRTADRAAQPGAPLWACCDFAAGTDLTVAEQAAIEAALEAAGLLDAWLSPEGEHPGHDSWLRPFTPTANLPSVSTPGQETAPTLGSVLTVVIPEGTGLAAETVDAVLTSIGLGAVGIAVGRDGRFSLGPLAGRAAKPAAEFIGATARADRRVRRLAEIDATLADIATELRRITADRDRIEADLTAWDDAARRAPDSAPLVDAAGRVRAATNRAQLSQEHAQAAAEAEAVAAAAASRAGNERYAVGTRRSVPTADDELDRFARLVAEFGDVGRDAVERRKHATSQRDLAAQQREDADQARAVTSRRIEEAVGAERAASAQRRRVDTLRRQLGPDAGSVFDEVAALDVRISELVTKVKSLGSDIEQNQTAVGEALGAITAARDRIGDAEGRLFGSVSRLPVLRGREVLALLALPTDDVPLDDSTFARWCADRLGPPPETQQHDQAKRAVDRAQKQLIDDLHSGYAPAIYHEDDLILVEVTSDDRSVFGLAELRERLAQQVVSMEQHLTDSDREIFERHLLNRVSHELRRLLGEADEFVRGVNEALARTKTASGLQVELRWTPAGDDSETRRALELLRRDTEQMGDDDRAALRQFFDLAIKRQRAEDPDAGYRANLEQVVDYRQWHRFQPFLVGPDGRARLTRERFRGLSGGEQAVALHLPLFAAAAAHYDRADPHAPRLVALDEAFAGIDEAMRGELMGLTVAFDLDVLLTGHELWGAYAEVPAIAVHDLLRRPPLEGVSVFTLRWDGHDLHQGPALVGSVGVGPAAPSEGLFAAESDTP